MQKKIVILFPKDEEKGRSVHVIKWYIEYHFLQVGSFPAIYFLCSFFFFFFFFFFVSLNQSDVLSRMRGHHNVGLGANGIFTTPQAGHGLLLGVELQAGLAVKGVGTATGNTLLVAGEGEHG